MESFVAWLAGYFLADGHDRLYRRYGKATKCKLEFDTKDHDLAVVVAVFTGGSYKAHVRRCVTGSECLVYTVSVGREHSCMVRSMQDSYKDFTGWYLGASEWLQDSFVQGFFDGDGTVYEVSANGRCKVAFTIGDKPARGILDMWCAERGLHPCVAYDRRGKGVYLYTFGTRHDVVRIAHLFRHGFLVRKKAKLDTQISLVDWYVVDNVWATIDKGLVRLRTGMSKYAVKASVKYGRPMNGHIVTKVRFKEIKDEVCIHY